MNKIYSDQDIWGTPPASATDTVLSDEDIWGTAPATAQTAAAPEVDDSTWLTDLQTGWQNLKGIFAANRFVQAQEDREAAAGPIHTTRGPPRPATPIEKAQRLKTAREDEAEALTAIGKSQAAVSKLPQSPAAKRFVGAKTFGEAWDAFAEDPWAVTRSTTLQSLPASIPSIVGGIAGSILGPAGAAAGAGYGSYMTEVGSAVQEALQERGANLSDPKSILATWNKHRDEITAYAQTRAGIIGTADTLTAGVSSKIGLTAPAKQWVKGEVKRQILGTGVEALGSAAGEAAAGLATKGEIQPGQVLAEGLGEIPGGAVQVAGQTVVGRLAGNQAGTEPPPSGAGNVPPGAAPPPPPQGPRQEPRLFPQQPAAAAPPPGFELDPEPATPPPAAAPSEDAYLAGAGWTAEQIADMSPEERAAAVEEAMAQGVEPVDLSAGAPAPGTAPRAPRGTRAARQPIQTPEDLEAVRPIVNAEPTEGQKAAGNYQKGHIRIHGLDVSIENPRGSIRSGTDPDGNQWQSPELPADYGYIKGSKGKDGDHVDVYIGPNPASDRVFVIDQMDLKTGKFDEHKSVMGADDLGQAVDLYVNSFDDPTLDRIGDVTEMSVAEFKEWVRDGRLTKRPAAKAGIGTVTPNTPEPVTSVTEQGEQEIPELMPAPEMGIPISGQPDDFGAMFDEAVDERLREEPAASEQVEIRASKRGRATVSVPRYWYHSPRGRDTANGIKGYPLPPKETELAQMFPTVGDRHVYISPQPLSADAVKIDISSFADRVRLTSQSEGYAIVQGDIPASAIESPKTVPDAALSDYIANTRKPLTQEAFAKHAGIDVTEAGQALQRAQAQGRILVGRNGYRRQRSFKSPPHLLDYLSTEGIQDPTGELAGMDLPRMGRYGPIIRASGLHPDEWRERLIEDGYLFDPGWGTDRQQETTVADVYDLIARHMAGPPVYSTYDQAEADAIATTRAAENQNPDFVDAPLIERRYGTEAMAGVESFFAISGTTEADWSQQELDDAARMIAEGMDPGDAFERAAMMHVENVPEEIIIDPAMEAAFRRNDPNVMVAFDPIPFDDLTETTDATEQQPQEAGDGVREAGPEGDAAGSEGQTPFAAEQVRGAGEVRGEPGSEEPAAEEGVGFDPEDPVAAAREARKEAFSRYPGEDQYAERREFINGANSSIPGPFASNEAVNDPAALAAHKAGMEWAEANGVPRRDWTQAQWGYHVPEAYMPLYDVPQYGLTYRKRVARDRALWDLNEDLVEANRTKKKPDAAYEALMARRKGILQGAEDAYLDQPVTLDAPTPTIEPGAEGKPQLVIPGAEQDVKGAMQNAAQKPLKGKPGQKDMDIGLFGSERDQTDLFDAPKTPKTQEAKPNSVSDKPNSATTEDLGSMFDDAVDERFGEEETPVVKPSLTTPNRLVIQTGVVLRTKSGRETSPAPKIEATNDRKTLNTIKRMNQWLLDEARKEVEGDDWQTQLLRGIDVNNLSRSDQDQINLVLFGDPDGATEDNVVRVETGKKPKTATQAAASAVKNTAMGLEDVAKGLSTLFGGKNKLSSGFTFDEDTYRQAIPFFKAGVAHFAQAGRDFRAMMKALVDYLASAGMDRDALTAMRPYAVRFMEDIRDGKESLDAPGSSEVLEPDRGDADAGDGVGAADVPASAGGSGPGARSGGRAGSRAGGRGPRGGRSLPPSHAPVVGEGGNLELPAREPEPLFSNPPDTEPVGSPADGGERLPDDRIPALDAIEAAAPGSDLESRKRAQKAAESIPVKLGDIDNIRQTLPLLHPEQQDDVRKVEERYSKPDGHGMLLTNGTGTGKTFSGLGVVKRFAKQGKTNILIVAPSKGILEDWQKAAKNFGLDVSVLESTQDKGNGIVATTYANLGQNPTLADRKWDLVVTDESHKLSSDANGTATSALEALRAISLHPDGMYRRGQMVFRKEWDRATALKPPEKGATREQVEAYEKALDEWRAKYDAARPGWQAGERGKVLMLSATPFAYHFSLDYAEGYLFTYPEVGSRGGYNQPGPRDQFYIENFGYRMRTGKLTKPDADVRSEVMERQFHEKLKKSGSLSGRALEVEKDYDRKFILVESGIGKRIDEALKFLREADDRKFLPLYDIVSKQFDYLTQLRLLEAIKAQAAIPYIKKSIALGRKVVVFHDYNEGGGISPFEMSIPEDLEVTVTGSDGKQKKVKPA
ncbi:MAG: DEAD/DEAH box helicase family protein, partial [Candidatus Polarisedimenticolia bacterium]